MNLKIQAKKPNLHITKCRLQVEKQIKITKQKQVYFKFQVLKYLLQNLSPNYRSIFVIYR